jgi:hypothetical protein
MLFAICVGGLVACLPFSHLGGHDVPMVDSLVEDFYAKLLVDIAYNAK